MMKRPSGKEWRGASRPLIVTAKGIWCGAAQLMLLCATFLLFVSCACDTRVRENPFDPLNPDTKGRPPLLTVIARDGFADVRWEDGDMLHIKRFTVYRGMSPDSLAPVVSLPPDQSLFREGGLSNDSTYYYAVGFAFEGQDDLLTAAEAVTPGPDLPWVIDAGDPPMALLGSDGRAVASRHGEGFDLVDLSVEAGRSLAWSVDPVEGALVAYDRAGDLGPLYTGFESPSRVSADIAEGGVWVISFDAGTLLRVDASGRRTVIDTTLFGPLDVESPPLGGCWVSDESGLIHRYSTTGDRTTVAQLARPVELSAAGPDEVWIADPVAGKAVRVSTEGVLAEVGDLDGPFGVAALPNGDCWIADRGRVLRVDRDGEITLIVGGFSGAGAVDYNPRTGDCWVADSLGDRIVRVGSDGSRLVTLTDVTTPFDVEGRWGRGD